MAAEDEAVPLETESTKSLALETVEKDRMIEEAIKKYDIEFFKQFSFSGKDALKLSQKGLEEFVISLENDKDVS